MVLVARGSTAEDLDVPAPGLGEYRLLLLGEAGSRDAGAEVGEVRRGGSPQLGMGFARGGEERVSEAGTRHGIARPFVTPLELPVEAPCAHRLGPPQEIRRDLRKGSLGQCLDLGHDPKVSLGPRENAYLD